MLGIYIFKVRYMISYKVAQSHRLTEGKTREKSLRFSPLPVSPYYTILDCTQGHYSVHTDPALCGPLTDSGCMYAGYFTSTVTPEVKVEQISDLKSGVEWSSDLELGWNLEQRKCEMGCPLTVDGC